MFARFTPAVLLLLTAACGQANDSPLSPDRTFVATLGGGSPLNALNFTAPANGGEEVPARDTRARGNAVFQVNQDGTEIDYKLIVSNINNVVQAHIHIAPAGVNGSVVVFLYPLTAPGGGTLHGVIATGTITAADLIGPLAGAQLSDLLDAMRSGGAYINVHTDDGDSTPNSGPGDFPGGEIRGQIGGGHAK